ncbi:TetR/AcrR family transcriptional regulator [Cellulomonas sp.]|uniref:TetR/AcrR family transcriptional regulator n=1 Tax=Cellulomonas sp. TaxID=40001 RepID=UPI002D68EF61|nr:TetR family transcriptional regulator [Cellulomonas sp.]HYQ73615.1 TetR family transcriptional regulator [Cellulomonas sp.]
MTRRHDPGRRDRIVDACLDVLAAEGVAGTSHRKVAAAADVPLGSMTYHFAGLDDLLRAAFDRYAREFGGRFDALMAAAPDQASAVDALVAYIRGEVMGDHRDLVLSHELYTLAARDPAYRDLTTAWMARSRASLERWFDPTTARALDALVEGLGIHRALDTGAGDDAAVEAGVRRVAGAG